MKPILLVVFIVTACNNQSSVRPTTESTISKEDSIVLRAKGYADSVFYYMNIAVNEMVKTKSKTKRHAIGMKMDTRCKPFQQKLDSLKNLVPNRKKEIDDYRQSLLNKVQNGTY